MSLTFQILSDAYVRHDIISSHLIVFKILIRQIFGPIVINLTDRIESVIL